MSTALSYRPDIDGLRAVAVLSVVLFHLGVGPVSGGFVGVDIFFVISGFLITTIISKGLNDGNFSIAEFYERRILRIFPALFVILLFTACASALLLFPADFDYFGETLSAAAAFGSNFIFWKESGYFEADSLTVPLLHTWSLAVEEQFYIFFPIGLMLVHKFLPRLMKPFIIVVLIASFIAALVATKMGATAVLFYLLPTRAWELLIGSVLALSVVPVANRPAIMNSLSVLGLALIGYAVFFFNEDTVFPGAAALLPTMGAAFLIYSGMNGESISRRLLSHKLPVFFGKISYSLYLWHWPLIVFFHYAAPVELKGVWSAALLLICIGLSCLSWKFVEQPVRYQTKFSRRKIFALSLIISIAFIGAGVVISKKEGFPDRFPKRIQELGNVTVGTSLPPVPNVQSVKDSYAYTVGSSKAPASFLVWGDSHADAAAPGIDLAARKEHKKGYVMGVHTCVPSVADIDIPVEKCNDVNQDVVKFLAKHPEIKTVILIGHWSIHEIRYAKQYKLGRTQSATLLRDTLDTLFTALEKQDRKIVFMIEMPHSPVKSVPLYLARAEHYGAERDMTFDLKTHLKRQEGIDPILAYLKERHDFKVIDPTEKFCPQGRCPMEHEGHALYLDNNHISTYGSKLYSDMYLPLLRD